MPFCPSCGKKGVKGLCEDCRTKELIVSIKEKKIIYCYLTQHVFIRNKWTPSKDLADAIGKALTDLIKTQAGVSLSFESDLTHCPEKPGIKKKVPVIVTATKDDVEEEYELLIDVEVTASPKVAKAGTDYLEGILQVRNVRDESIIQFIRNELIKLEPKGMHINKEKRHKDGIDFVITKKNLLRGFSEKIVNELGGEVEFHTQIFSMDKNTLKDILRLNVKMTLSPYLKGDVVVTDDKIILVRTTKKKDVSGIDLETGKRASFSIARKKPEIYCERNKYLNCSITRLSPHVEVMHPETFESTQIRNETYLRSVLKDNKFVVGKGVKIVDYNGLWFVK